jgi:YVTN family beta-propeller protein
VANSGSNNVSAYSIHVDGSLSAVVGSPFVTGGSSPCSIAADPGGKFAYAKNSGGDNVSAFRIDATTGALTAVTGSPFSSASSSGSGFACDDFYPYGGSSSPVTVDSSGSFVYAGTAGSVDLVAYGINATTGALTEIAGSPFPAANAYSCTWSVASKGQFLYTVCGIPDKNYPEVYRINSDGSLNPQSVDDSLYAAAGNSPVSIAINPSGTFAYAVNSAGNDISVYSVNVFNGSLTPLTLDATSRIPAGSLPWAVTVDPSGKFVYVANRGSNNVSAYIINTVTGMLTEMAGSPFAAGTAPNSVVVDPSGKFVYVVNRDSNNVSAYNMNATTGALSSLVGSPFVAGIAPLSIAITK